MKKKILIPVIVVLVFVSYGYGVRLTDAPPQQPDESGVFQMTSYQNLVIPLDETRKVSFNKHGFALVKLDNSETPPEFAMFEVSSRSAGILPYRASFECPLIETGVNTPIPTSERNCFTVLFS